MGTMGNIKSVQRNVFEIAMNPEEVSSSDMGTLHVVNTKIDGAIRVLVTLLRIYLASSTLDN